MPEVHCCEGVVGSLAGCHRRRASPDAAVRQRGMWGKGVGCGEAVTGLDRQCRGRLWVCLGGAADGAFCSAWERLKTAIVAMFLTPFFLRYLGIGGLVHVLSRL